jgi:hypothetical protein
VPQNFENLFAKYDSDRDGAISLADIIRLMKGQRVAADPFGVSPYLFQSSNCRLLILNSGELHCLNGGLHGCYFKKRGKCTRRTYDSYMMYRLLPEYY